MKLLTDTFLSQRRYNEASDRLENLKEQLAYLKEHNKVPKRNMQEIEKKISNRKLIPLDDKDLYSAIGVYIVSDKEKVLYVGCSHKVGKRILTHNKFDILNNPKISVRIEACRNVAFARRREAFLIFKLQPKLNSNLKHAN